MAAHGLKILIHDRLFGLLTLVVVHEVALVVLFEDHEVDVGREAVAHEAQGDILILEPVGQEHYDLDEGELQQDIGQRIAVTWQVAQEDLVGVWVWDIGIAGDRCADWQVGIHSRATVPSQTEGVACVRAVVVHRHGGCRSFRILKLVSSFALS